MPVRIDDELLDKLGDFFSSDYVATHQPWLREMTFQAFVTLFFNWRMLLYAKNPGQN